MHIVLYHSVRRKRVNYTFRIDEDMFKSIEKEANEKGIAVSSLMCRITRNYVQRDRFLEQLGFIPVGKDVIRSWLDRIPEDLLQDDAEKLGSTIAREYITYFFHDIDVHTLIQFLDVWLGTLGGELQKKEHYGTHTIAINHCVSIQYSLYLKEFLRALIEPITSQQVKFVEITSNLVSFSFKVK